MGNDSFNKVKFFMDNYPVWKDDWNKFVRDIGDVRLDNEQQEILDAIRVNRRVSVRSGTARGKDFVAAVASVCFLYLTVFDENWEFQATKVVNTAPTGRQIKNIMIPEIAKFYTKAHGILPGNMMSDGIRFDEKFLKDWFLVGFKAGDDAVEAWSGIHAPNVMVVVTEASGIDQITFDAIEGILQGNSRLVLIFNPNRTVGEAYKSQTSSLYHKFVLNCLDAPNVTNKKLFLEGKITEQELKSRWIPGQVDYDWVDEKIRKPGWAFKISPDEVNKAEFDFQWNGEWYRPSDLFRVKVLGEFPKESEDQLIPLSWVEAAQERYRELMETNPTLPGKLKLGVDVAGMGRDMTIFLYRKEWIVYKIQAFAKMMHTEIAGRVKTVLTQNTGSIAFIDTIGEGSGVYSILDEQGMVNAISVKFSEGATGLTDITEGYEFLNMRAYLFWCVRDWLNPAFKSQACLPDDDDLVEELTSVEYKFQSNGKIQIESKEDIIKKLGRSIDKFDALANTFYPVEQEIGMTDMRGIFH